MNEICCQETPGHQFYGIKRNVSILPRIANVSEALKNDHFSHHLK